MNKKLKELYLKQQELEREVERLKGITENLMVVKAAIKAMTISQSLKGQEIPKSYKQKIRFALGVLGSATVKEICGFLQTADPSLKSLDDKKVWKLLSSCASVMYQRGLINAIQGERKKYIFSLNPEAHENENPGEQT